MPYKKNIILQVFIFLLFTGCGGGEETSQQSRFSDLPEYNLERVRVLGIRVT